MRLATLLLVMAAMPLRAQELCGADPETLNKHISGTWMSEVVASRVHVAGVKENGPSGHVEAITFHFSSDGTGQMVIKNQSLDAMIQEPGGLAMLAKPDHLSAFAAASDFATPEEKAPHKDCDIRFVPQISASKPANDSAEVAKNEVELILLAPELMAGAQVVTLEIEGVETKIVSALLLRRDKGALQ